MDMDFKDIQFSPVFPVASTLDVLQEEMFCEMLSGDHEGKKCGLWWHLELSAICVHLGCSEPPVRGVNSSSP